MAVKLHAILPVKPFDQAKSRLADALSPQQRAACSEWMLSNTLRCLSLVPEIDVVTAISRDPLVLALAERHHASTLLETQTELNLALHQAAAAVPDGSAILVIPADLPLLTAQDLIEFTALFQHRAGVVIAPDRHCQGTNALLLPWRLDFCFRFGINSYHAHQLEARRLGLPVTTASIPNLAFDLDTPEDLELFGRMKV
jgi:2-phospho-L-lactate/phosphoenolpyruvate guanylyltransferase